MLLAIAASTLLLRDRAFPPRSTTLSPPPVEIRPATRCHASRSTPLRPPANAPVMRPAPSNAMTP